MNVYAAGYQRREGYVESIDSLWWSEEQADAAREDMDPGPHGVFRMDVQGDPPWAEHDASADSPEAPGARCPFLGYVGGLGMKTSARCSHPARDEFVVNLCYGDVAFSTEAMGSVPDDCPLRKRAVLVYMEGD